MAKKKFAKAKDLFDGVVEDVRVIDDNKGLAITAKYQSALCDFFLENYDETRSKLNEILAGRHRRSYARAGTVIFSKNGDNSTPRIERNRTE